MYTVIIPTMWLGSELSRTLPKIVDHPLVTEVLIINNARDKTPKGFSDKVWPKTRIYWAESNLGVNPAWDLAIQASTNDLICLCSDDVDFDVSVFDFLSDKLSPDLGIVGPSSISSANLDPSKPIQIHERERILFGFGVLMFFHKKNYVPFPPNFKIFCGDVWLVRNDIQNGRKPRILSNFQLKTRIGTTSSLPQFSQQAEYENSQWEARFGSVFNFISDDPADYKIS